MRKCTKNIVPPTPGIQGDIYAVNAANQSVFTKLIEGVGPSQPMQINNMPLEILSDNGLAPAILGVGSDAAHGMPAIIEMGNLATQDSFSFAYDDTIKELALGQNNACVNYDFNINLGTGNLNLTANLKLNSQLKDSTGSAGTANQYLASNGLVTTWTNLQSDKLPNATFIVYVNKSGNDILGNGSLNNPFLTCAAAMASITYATATQRVIINLGPGIYTDNFLLKANVFIIGAEALSTKLGGTITINDNTWNNGNDNRSGFSSCSVVNATIFDFTPQSATAGKLYFYDCWFDLLLTLIAFGPINQILLFDCILFNGWSQTGMESALNNCTFFGGDIVINSSSVCASYCQLDSCTCSGNLSGISTGGQAVEIDLYSSFIPGIISISGSSAVLYYTSDSIPTFGISISGGALATNLNLSVVSNLISSYSQLVPGNYNVVVPANATNCTISAVGGGGGGCYNAGFASPGAGLGGAIINYPTSVSPGQTINITVGQGGAVNTDGTDTIIVLGTQTITCGKGLTSTNQTNGGNGGSVTLWSGNTIAGGVGGAFQAVGANGNISYFVYTGSGGGGTRANGGNNILFTGGIADANYGGGGASAFANGANNHSNGTLGSGGAADNGIGGNGYVHINFYS